MGVLLLSHDVPLGEMLKVMFQSVVLIAVSGMCRDSR